jgi:cytochrome c biogenesis protein ResB
MERPKPAKYASLLTMTREAETDTVSIEVNNPVHMKGYSVYQVSYDEHLGKWSQVSMLEAVKDPWLPVIYAGIIMVLAGSVYLFWKGNEIRKE